MALPRGVVRAEWRVRPRRRGLLAVGRATARATRTAEGVDGRHKRRGPRARPATARRLAWEALVRWQTSLPTSPQVGQACGAERFPRDRPAAYGGGRPEKITIPIDRTAGAVQIGPHLGREPANPVRCTTNARSVWGNSQASSGVMGETRRTPKTISLAKITLGGLTAGNRSSAWTTPVRGSVCARGRFRRPPSPSELFKF